MSETLTRAKARNNAGKRRIARVIRAAALLVAASCAGGAGSGAGAAQALGFDPITFFTGATESTGSLKQTFSSAKATRVSGFGAMRGNGQFVLDQTMTVSGEPAKKRQWQLHQISPGHFGGTISDGKGPVTIDVAGNRLLIKYTMTNGLKVQSVLTIDPGGRSGHNHSTVRKWGITAATLDETISKR
jgi:hypothetical protein